MKVTCATSLRPAFLIWWRTLNRNSYEAPKQEPPCAVPITTGPGASRKRSQAGDLLERQPRTGADEQPVVGELIPGARRDRVRGRVDLRSRLVDEPDPLARVHRRERKRHIPRIAPKKR